MPSRTPMRAGDLYEAGLVHAQYHRILPTGRHWNLHCTSELF